ncbi:MULTISPECIES: hypothetical protein [unclassified Chryseobacterium]|uniref:hypothetical protein n=1 Tax=unclassified Chryseobacterium TaxID=2593645 RepID=UPI000E0C7837|nr:MULTISPECIES: hypothetical protein [unclassified Chryseobacterium]MDQ1858810.1 hypothetical protein [Chryseobacterium sp. WLY505]
MNTESNNPLQPGTMSNSLIQALIDNYRQNHLSAINTTLGIQDAHSIWFDLPKLKNFIAKIEEEAAKVDPATSAEDLGIRFYYASYPKTENWDIMASHPVPQEYAEKHTLVLIPTMKKTNETGVAYDSDFNTLQAHGEGKAFGLSTAKSKSAAYKHDDDGTVGENSGTLIPPAPPMGTSY